MGLTISAQFVLGTYQGRSATGTPEPFPETDRLFAALVAAAGAGPHAEWEGWRLRISPRHRDALRWLESNPPDRMAVADYRFNVPGATAYRVTGLRTKGAYASPGAADAVARSSFSGPISWRWDTTPPAEVLTTLGELASEVAYLGEANSPVLVEVREDDFPLQNELVRVGDDELFPAASVPISTPEPGRLEALERSHAERFPALASKGGKSSKAETEAESESEIRAARPGEALTLLWYRQAEVARGPRHLPWRGAIVLEAKAQGSTTIWPPRAEDRVAWAVALHRALAKVISPDAPPILTGRYAEGTTIPANRLAIQIVTTGDPLGWTATRGVEGAFALLIPAGATPEEQDAIIRAVQLVAERTIYLGHKGAVKLARVRFVEGQEFWRPQPEGLQRWWVPRPLAMAETRPQGKAQGGRPWGIEEAALLSLGMVWRDAFGLSGKGAAFYQSLVEAARKHVQVLKPRQIVGQALLKYVHRVSPSNVLTAYTALLRFDDLVDPRAPLAVGQSRHLGTGLLIPVDLPPSLVMEDGGVPWP